MVEKIAGVLRDGAAGNQFVLAKSIYTDILPDAGSNSVNAATAYARSVSTMLAARLP